MLATTELHGLHWSKLTFGLFSWSYLARDGVSVSHFILKKSNNKSTKPTNATQFLGQEKYLVATGINYNICMLCVIYFASVSHKEGAKKFHSTALCFASQLSWDRAFFSPVDSRDNSLVS